MKSGARKHELLDKGTAGGWQASLPRGSNMVVQFGGGCAVALLIPCARDGAGASAGAGTTHGGGRSCGRVRVAVAAAVVSSRT